MDLYSFNMIAIVLTFIIGYTGIILEHKIHINKATSAIFTAVVMWAIVFASPHASYDNHLSFLHGQLSSITQIVLFLIGALSIVEIISMHQGFSFVSSMLHVRTKRQLLWLMGIMTFFLSSVLDNLTTTIVMVTMLQRICHHRIDRWLIGSGIVIAANAGGAWTPIGDVTTTMLWIGGQLTTSNIISHLFLPSIACMLVSFLVINQMVKGNLEGAKELEKMHPEPYGKLVLILGLGSLIFVPVFKLITGLPPFMGVLFGLAVLWIITDIVHHRHPERGELRVVNVIKKIDLSSVMFFLGILLAVGALEEAGILEYVAQWLEDTINIPAVIAGLIGIFSAIVDNVPLVAASMGMYDLVTYPQDAPFWEMIAYCAGTGGSILIIGSAAGVVFMGMEKVDFFWYLRKIAFAAFLGYVAGLFVYIVLETPSVLF